MLQLLAGEDGTLLVRRDALPWILASMVSDDSTSEEGDRLACQRLDKDLRATAEAEDEDEVPQTLPAGESFGTARRLPGSRARSPEPTASLPLPTSSALPSESSLLQQ